MVQKELFETNITHILALLSHPIRSLLGPHSDDIIHQERTLLSKEEHLLADVSAHGEVHNFNKTICLFFSKSCLWVVFSQGGGQIGGG